LRDHSLVAFGLAWLSHFESAVLIFPRLFKKYV
jgi:hypothetical protein